MDKYLLPTLLLLSQIALGQTTDQLSVGANYINASFYNIADGTQTSISHTAWDIAFEVDLRGAAIHVNEGVASSFSSPLPQVELYYSGRTDFAIADTTGAVRIYNPETSWSVGAFNTIASPTNPFDFGWGEYDPTTHTLNGSRIFFVKIRSGVMKKIQIQSMAGGIYTFRYADLDGNNELIQTINKADFPNKTLAYYSLENDEILDLEPTNWDILFTRYSTPLDDGQGGIIEYTVTGILHNVGVQVAVADDIDPQSISFTDYSEQYSDTISTIGYDWKEFDFQGGWVLDEERVYFVKTATDSIYRLQFIDFEGSSTGTATFQSTFEAELVNSTSINEVFPTVKVYPNPVTDFVQIDFTATETLDEATIELVNNLGQRVTSQTIRIDTGENHQRLNFNALSGLYHVIINAKNLVITRPILVK